MFTSYLRNSGLGVTLIVALLIVLLLAGGGAPDAPAEPAAASLNPGDADYPITHETERVSARAETFDQVELAEWALDVYASAGLELPHVEMWMAHDTSSCIHPSGDPVRGFTTWRDGQAVLFHCGDAFTMLHELAHLYDRHVLSDADRETFLTHRGLKHWQVKGKWGESGEEHFANILAWGLDKGARREFETLPNDDASLARAFALIAQAEPTLATVAATHVHDADYETNRTSAESVEALRHEALRPAAVAEREAADPELEPVATYDEPIGPVPVGPRIVTAQHRRVIEWALGRFAEAQLELGAVAVGVYETAEPCGGHRGLHRSGVVSICAIHENPMVQQAWQRHTLLHELAHEWTESTVTSGQRAELLELRAVSTWDDKAFEWQDRGVEQAAEVIAWGIADYPVSIHVWIEDRDCDGLAAAYRLLTDSEPLTGLSAYCD